MAAMRPAGVDGRSSGHAERICLTARAAASRSSLSAARCGFVRIDGLGDPLDRPVGQAGGLAGADLRHRAGAAAGRTARRGPRTGAGARTGPHATTTTTAADIRAVAGRCLGVGRTADAVGAEEAVIDVVVGVRPERVVGIRPVGVVDEVVIGIRPEHRAEPADDVDVAMVPVMPVAPVAVAEAVGIASAERRLRQRTRRRRACRALGQRAVAQHELPVTLAAPDQRTLGAGGAVADAGGCRP